MDIKALAQKFFDASNDMDSDGFSGELGGYEIELSREDESDSWYIQVRVSEGGHLYDGWWRGSELQPLETAMEEAIKGSGLLSNFQKPT
jgi:hypothetical protein